MTSGTPALAVKYVEAVGAKRFGELRALLDARLEFGGNAGALREAPMPSNGRRGFVYDVWAPSKTPPGAPNTMPCPSLGFGKPQ